MLGKEKNKLEILQQNMTLLKNEFMYNEPVLCRMPKNTSTSENYCPTQRQSLHHLQPQSEQRDVNVHSRFQQSRNELHKKKKIVKHKNMNYTKIIEHRNSRSSKTNWVSCL